MRRWRLLVLALISATVAAARHEDPASAPASGFAPIEYFQQSCARCHGPYGSGYDVEALGKLPPGELRRVISEMASGPAQAGLSEPQVDQLTAYHRSLIDGTPFIAVTGRSDKLLEGEITPNSKLVLQTESGMAPIHIDEHHFVIHGGTSRGKLIATNEGRMTELDSSTSNFSHATTQSHR